MEHLSTLEAGFLEVEDADPHVSMAIGGISVLTGPAPDFGALLDVMSRRVEAAPRLRQLLHYTPWDLAAPQWADDTEFDITHHVRKVAVPRPGDDTALNTLTADIMGRRLDRARPLWECWVIEGLANNRWAVLMKIHHCIADGIATARLLERLCDDDATNPPRISAAVSHTSTGRNIGLNPWHWVTGAWRTSVGLAGVSVQAAQGAAEILSGLVRPAASSLNGPVSGMRRFAAAEVSMADVERVCHAFDVTINDVALTAITDAFRSMLIGRGEQPRRTSLPTLVPVSLRTPDAAETTDNRVSVMLPYLPVDLADPVQQLQAVHKRLTTAKGSGQREAGNIFISAANLIPFAVSAWAVKSLSKLPQRGVVTLATNVPGPRKRLQIMGREVVRLAPIPPLGMQLRTGIAILSYADHLTFGILSDYDSAPEAEQLAAGIEAAVARLALVGAAAYRSATAPLV